MQTKVAKTVRQVAFATGLSNNLREPSSKTGFHLIIASPVTLHSTMAD